MCTDCLTFGLSPGGALHIRSAPAKRPVTGPPRSHRCPVWSSPVISPFSCACSFPSTAQGAPSLEYDARTHQSHMPLSTGSEIGQEAGLETPLPSPSDALVSPAAYFSPLTHTSRRLPSSFLTGRLLLLTTAMLGLLEYCCLDAGLILGPDGVAAF